MVDSPRPEVVYSDPISLRYMIRIRAGSDYRLSTIGLPPINDH